MYMYTHTHTHNLLLVFLPPLKIILGNSTQYSVMTDMGKKSKNEWIYVYV